MIPCTVTPRLAAVAETMIPRGAGLGLVEGDDR